MSRSYRKPYVREEKKKWAKRQANKRVRRCKNLQDGCRYKKIYNSWNICDYGWYWDKPINDNGELKRWKKFLSK
jgi:hypothetical protein